MLKTPGLFAVSSPSPGPLRPDWFPFGAPAPLTPPLFIGDSTITGDAFVGSVLLCTPASVSGNPSPTLAFQWRADAINISGATDPNFEITEDELGADIDCVVTASNTEGSDESIADAVGPVDFEPQAPVFTGTSNITGTTLVGQLLTCNAGSVIGWPTPTLSYQWRAEGVNIGGATASTYTIVVGDLGDLIDCVVTATNTEGTDEDTAEAVGPVTSGNTVPEFTGASSITGDPYIGETLTCVPGTRTGTPTPTLTYQWQSDNEDITGETANTIEVLDDYQSTMLRCIVTATNTEGSDQSTTSAVGPIDYEPAIPVFTGASSITGDPYVGETLTCVPGTRTGYPTPTLTFQWRAATVNISGATSNTWLVDDDYLGDDIDCVVTATNASGNDTDTAPEVGPVDYAPAAPVFTGSSVISGTPEVGQTLTCTPGTRTGYPTPTVTFQWRAEGVNIGGATASTYVLTSGESGDDIDCVVTATNIHGNDTDTSNTLGPVTTPGNSAPAFTGATFIYGNAEVGETLTCVAGAVTGFPTPSLTYQWRSDAVNIGGETSSTFVVTTTQYGEEIDCVVTATNTEGNDTDTSNSLGPVPESVAPSFDAAGTPQAGTGALNVPWPAGDKTGMIAILWVESANEVVANPDSGTWDQLSCSPQSAGTAGTTGATRGTAFIANGASSNADVAIADVGDHAVAVITTFKDTLDKANAIAAATGQTSSSATNPYSTGTVTTDADKSLVVHGIFGRNDNQTSQVANAANADGTVNEHVDFSSNQGNGGGVAVLSFVKETEGLTQATTFDHIITGVTCARMTIALRPAPASSGPTNTAPPDISGVTTVGETLTASGATWDLGDPTATITHQWYRNSVAIGGATSSTYELVEDDEGALIGYRQFASNTIGLVYAEADEVGPIDPFDLPEGGIFGPEFGPEFE